MSTSPSIQSKGCLTLIRKAHAQHLMIGRCGCTAKITHGSHADLHYVPIYCNVAWETLFWK